MEDYRLDTPEAVAISYDIAGIGTRFLAAILDALVWAGLQLIIVIGSVSLASFGGVAQNAALILGLTLSFILFFGYYILFETIWSGQTPGKRVLNIRVIKTTGYPIGFLEAAIRNLIRIADFLPMWYAAGILTMFLSKQARRLGDYAAGTLVVKERGPLSLKDVDTVEEAPVGVSTSAAALGEIDPDELRWNLPVLAPDDLRIVHEFLARSPSLEPKVRARIGDEIAVRVADRIGARHPLDPVRFLQRVVYLYDAERSPR